MLPPRTVLKFTAAAATISTAAWTARHAGSPAVRSWEPPKLPGRHWGRLWARSGGSGDTAIMLLHGLVSTGDIFGAAFDDLAANHRMVVPDLLGFGRSLDESRSSFTTDEHLDALDELAGQSDVMSADRIIVGAHSMGSSLALRWAARHADRIERVVCWGVPIYPCAHAAQTHISGSVMARLLVLDTQWARRACALSCRFRTAAGLLTAAAEPRLPVPIARAVPLHTWPAYRDAMQHLVIKSDWAQLLHQPGINDTELEFVWGEHDRVGDRRHAARLLREHSNATMTVVPGADRQLPTARPDTCITHLRLIT